MSTQADARLPRSRLSLVESRGPIESNLAQLPHLLGSNHSSRWCAVPRGMYRIDPGRSPIGGLVGPTAVSTPLAAADWASPV